MSEYSEIEKENRNESVSQEISQNTNVELDSYEFNDNRIESYQLKNLQMKADNSSKTSQLKVFQLKANNTLQFNPEEEDFSREGRDAMDEGQLKYALENASLLVAEVNGLIVDGAISAKLWHSRLQNLRKLSIAVGIGFTAIGIGIATGGAGWAGILGYFAALSVAEAAGFTVGIGGGMAIAEGYAERKRDKIVDGFKPEGTAEKNQGDAIGGTALATEAGFGVGGALALQAGKNLASVGLSSTGLGVAGLQVIKEGYDIAKDISWEYLNENTKQVFRDEIFKIQGDVHDVFAEFPPFLEDKYGDDIETLIKEMENVLSKIN